MSGITFLLKKQNYKYTEKKNNVLFHRLNKDTQMYQTFDFTQIYIGEKEHFLGEKRGNCQNHVNYCITVIHTKKIAFQ